MPKKLLSLFVLACLVSSCAAERELLLAPRSAAVPAGVDFSGRWQLRSGQPEPQLPTQEEKFRIPVDSEQMGVERHQTASSRSKRGKSDGTLVQVFFETGEALKITQTIDGIFISFDRSIVEEYRFGEQRFISVGPVEAERVSGWDGDRYVIETLDEEHALLTESYHIENDGTLLIREITMTIKNKEVASVRQLFDRVD